MLVRNIILRHMENFLISLSLSLILGLLLSRIAKKIGLPAVTAYIIAGVILGPFVLGKMNFGGIGYHDSNYIENFAILSKTALGFIAFMIGNEFRLKDLEKMGRGAITVGIFQAVFTTLLVDLVLIGVSLAFPNLLSLPSAITLGAIAAATAPAATLMVVKQYKAHGPLTKLLLMVVALDDAVGLMLFSVSFGIAQALESGNISTISIVAEPLIEMGMSVVIGVLSGLFLNYLERFFHSRSKRLSLVVAFVMLIVGISLSTFSIGDVHIRSSLLLTCMIAGCTFCNVCNASEEIMDRLDRWTGPILVLFFVISGAELDFSVLKDPLVLALGLCYIATRSTGKIYGAYLSSRLERMDVKTQKHLGITLLPQAGVALGMANSSLILEQGKIICNIVLFSVFIYEIAGPYMTKNALIKAGEIDTEARKSSRVENKA